ncbi:MAG TPA: MBL fold hydrolase [Bacteroidetes bacterium]|nr:MBL fold hydrolase [Bacteroidota bacterium]HCN37852.1 MBL fold hydrolase [Bacteroidota bacterium]
MKVIKFPVNPFQMNSYIYYDEKTGDGVIFDPAVYFPEEKDKLEEIIIKNNINIKKILLTHGHIDHILGNKYSKDRFKVDIYGNDKDNFLIENAVTQGKLYGIEMEESPSIDVILNEGDKIDIADTELRIIHTPGHSPGSICYIDDNNKIVFCGDVVFRESIGRTDLPGGDYNLLISSIKDKLFKEVKEDYILLPGHMEETNVGHEIKYNPFLN